MKNTGYKSLFCIYAVSNDHFMFVFKLIIGNELQLRIECISVNNNAYKYSTRTYF